MSIPYANEGYRCLIANLQLCSYVGVKVFCRLISGFLVLFTQLMSCFMCVATVSYVLVERSSVAMNNYLEVCDRMLVLFPRAIVLVFFRTPRRTSIVRVVAMSGIMVVQGVEFIGTFRGSASYSIAITVRINSRVFLVIS